MKEQAQYDQLGVYYDLAYGSCFFTTLDFSTEGRANGS